MTDVLVSAQGLSAGYGGIRAVRDVNLELQAGEVVTLLGPNGAGKTTVLLALTGLLPAMTGTVHALGERVTSRTTARLARAGLALVPDDRGIFADLTVAEHFRLAQERKDAERLRTVLDHFPALEPLLGRRAGLLSGGEQQMLALAKALVRRPRVLMVDEMSLGLAPIIVQSMLPSLRRLAVEEGIGVLLVEQHVTLALAVSDRAVVLGHSHVVLEDTAERLLAEPHRVEAAYFGTADGAA